VCFFKLAAVSSEKTIAQRNDVAILDFGAKRSVSVSRFVDRPIELNLLPCRPVLHVLFGRFGIRLFPKTTNLAWRSVTFHGSSFLNMQKKLRRELSV
jgi:hypothetical protein